MWEEVGGGGRVWVVVLVVGGGVVVVVVVVMVVMGLVAWFRVASPSPHAHTMRACGEATRA